MKRPRRTTTGIILMCLSQILFVCSWTTIKIVGQRLPLFEIILFRALFSLIILAPLTHWHMGTFRGVGWITIFLRSLTGMAAMILAFYAIIHIEIGNASTLFNTLPIFVAILAPALLGESFRWIQFALVLVAFGGIALILKPDADVFQGISLYALLAGFLAALSMICIRRLRRTDSVLTITLHFTLFTFVVSLPFAISHFIWPTPKEWALLILIGVVVTFAQIMLTRAYHFGRAATIAPFSYVSVIGAYVAGLLFFSEIPDWLSLVGAVIVVIAGIGVMLAAPAEQKVPGSTPGART